MALSAQELAQHRLDDRTRQTAAMCALGLDPAWQDMIDFGEYRTRCGLSDAEWKKLKHDPEFLAEVDVVRAKLTAGTGREGLRLVMQMLTPTAARVLAELMTSDDVSPPVRLKAVETVLSEAGMSRVAQPDGNNGSRFSVTINVPGSAGVSVTADVPAVDPVDAEFVEIVE